METVEEGAFKITPLPDPTKFSVHSFNYFLQVILYLHLQVQTICG